MYSLCAIMMGNLSCKSTEAGRPECDVQQQSVAFHMLLSVARPPNEML